MRESELVCVNCPKGCKITVLLDGDKVKDVRGYSGEEGLNYARQEVTRPMRILTSTVKIDGAIDRVLPVITDGEIPLDMWQDAMNEIQGIRVSAPVKINDVISENFLGTGVNLVASRSIGVVSFKYSR